MFLTARRLGQLAVLLITTVGVSGPALAAPGDFVNCEQRPTAPECILNPSVPGSPAQEGGHGGSAAKCRDSGGRIVPCYIPGKGWYGGDGCWWQPATGDELAAAEALGGTAVPPERWYIGSCGDPLIDFWPASLVRFRLSAGQGPSVEVLADQAVRRLQLPAPVIRVNPRPPAPQVVFVPTWLWVDSDFWGERSASAAAGGLTVTATATPTTVEWSMGDGRSVTCHGSGTPWKSGVDPSMRSPSCGHVYTTAPPAGRYLVQATVTWEIAWAGGGESGARPALTTTASASLRVVEAGALNTSGVS